MDTYIDDNGYERFSDSDILVHRWAAEKKLKRKLRRGEVVHHKDRNKTNNHPNNLHVFPNQAAHDRAHKFDAYRFGKRASYQGFKSKEENSGCMVILVFIIVGIGFFCFL
jgi:hypothetical protein